MTAQGSAQSEGAGSVAGVGVVRMGLVRGEEVEDMEELVMLVVLAAAAFTSARHSAKIFDRRWSVGDVGCRVPVVGVVIVEGGWIGVVG